MGGDGVGHRFPFPRLRIFAAIIYGLVVLLILFRFKGRPGRQLLAGFAITHNCTTEIYTLKSMKAEPLDWRILMNGKADEMAYERGFIVTGGLPFQELKQRAWINQAAKAADHDADFSTRIRENRPGF
jgi:hypothetical protein